MKIKVIFLRSAQPLLLLALVNFVVYHDYWLGYKVITSKDFLTGFYPLLNFQSDCLQEFSWPLWNPYMNFGYPFVEHYINTSFFPTHFLMGLITGSTLTVIHWELLFWIILGGLGMYLCVREYGYSPLAGLISGISFMFCGQMLVLPQWSLIVYNAAGFPYLLLGYRRAERLDKPFSLISIAFLAMTMLGGYLSTTVLGIYVFSVYVFINSIFSKRIAFGIKYLTLTLLFSLLLASPKLVPIYNAVEAGPRIASYDPAKEKDPFNIINFYNFMSLLLPVKYYFSLYIGGLGIIALLHGIARRSIRINPLLIMAVLSAWLLMVDREGNVSFLRSISYMFPLMKVVRNEWIHWYYPSIFAMLYLSKYLDGFLSEKNSGVKIASVVSFLALLSIIFFTGYNKSLYYRAYITHCILGILWFFITFLNERGKLQSFFVIALVTAEFFLVFNRVNVDELPLKEGNHIRIAIGDQAFETQSFKSNVILRPKFYAWMVKDNLRPSISQSRNWPYLISGIDGDPAYNLYPEQYGKFIDFMNLKKFSGWWHNTQERFEFMKIKDSPMLSQMEGQPLYALFDREMKGLSGEVSFDRISCSGFGFTTQSPQPGVFLLHQMYDHRWKVYVDEKEQHIRRADEFFMAADVGPGDHKVRFVFRDMRFNSSVVVSLLTFTGIIIFAVARRDKAIKHD